jgi:hypothetical protein
MTVVRKLIVLFLVLAAGPFVGLAHAQADKNTAWDRLKGDPVRDAMKQWFTATQDQDASKIPPGTKITMSNWQQYKQFMPFGMIGFFEGKWYWKMPSDVEIPIGPTRIIPFTNGYLEATEKYSAQTRVVHEPDGRMDVANYVAGQPFPNPQEPDKGYKILANIWWRNQAHILAGSPATGDSMFCSVDRFANSSCLYVQYLYRQLAYNSDPGVPRTESTSHGFWYSEWLMTDIPEQARYTAVLTLHPMDVSEEEDDYTFVPSLRRSLRLSTSARCSPLFGSDLLKDDQRSGFNGGLARFDPDYLGSRKIIAITELTGAQGKFPENYDMPMGWSKPSWGDYQVRDVNVLDIRRIPSMQGGYCYGSKIDYVDNSMSASLWEEVYDANLQLWKVAPYWIFPVKDSKTGDEYAPMGSNSSWYDLQNDHVTHIGAGAQDGTHNTLLINHDVPPEYWDLVRYTTPTGLSMIMR